MAILVPILTFAFIVVLTSILGGIGINAITERDDR